MYDNLRVNGGRLWASLMDMAEIGATPKGGVNRISFADEDRRSRDFFTSWCGNRAPTVAGRDARHMANDLEMPS